MLTARRFWVDAHNQLPPMPKTAQLSLFGRSLNDLVLSASPTKRAAGTTVKLSAEAAAENDDAEEDTILAPDEEDVSSASVLADCGKDEVVAKKTD